MLSQRRGNERSDHRLGMYVSIHWDLTKEVVHFLEWRFPFEEYLWQNSHQRTIPDLTIIGAVKLVLARHQL